jgi:hypothetical protein
MTTPFDTDISNGELCVICLAVFERAHGRPTACKECHDPDILYPKAIYDTKKEKNRCKRCLSRNIEHLYDDPFITTIQKIFICNDCHYKFFVEVPKPIKVHKIE